MDLKTNVVIKGPMAKVVYETMKKSSQTVSLREEKRLKQLAEFSKKIRAVK